MLLDKEYPIQWCESRVNLAELAKLRYLHGWDRKKLAHHYGRTLDAITKYCQKIRRKDFNLDGLSTEEKGENHMGIQKLIPIAVTLAFLAVSTGQLTRVIKANADDIAKSIISR